MRRFLALALFAVVVLRSGSPVARGAEPPLVEKHLIAGRLADGDKELADRLKAQPADDQARFGRGTLQFLGAIEHLSQSLYKFGALGPASRLGRQIPLVRLAVPRNPAPEKIRYADV